MRGFRVNHSPAGIAETGIPVTEVGERVRLESNRLRHPNPDSQFSLATEETDSTMDEPNLAKSPRKTADLIAIAIEAEKKAAWFYSTMAKLTTEAVARETLEALADDENSHAQTLADLYIEVTGHEVDGAPPAAPEGEPNFFDFPSISRRAALEFALRNEVKAADLYQSQAGACNDPRHAEIFKQLASTENEHAACLRLQRRQHTGWTEH